MKIKRSILALLVITSIGLMGCSNKTENKEVVNTEIQNEETQSQQIEYTMELPEYKVELIDNSNIGSVIRETIHIVVEGDYTLEELYSIAEKEALLYTKDNKVNALTVGFYREKDNIGKGYDMGRVEYVPNGELGDAVKVTTGDYSNFEFVNYLSKHMELPQGQSIDSTSGETDLETVKNDILDVESSSIVDISKDGDTLVISIKEQEDHPFVDAEENAIATYTDWCLENIKSDITKLDISVTRPNSSVRAVLDLADMETSNGRYFDTNYIAKNII